MSFQQAIADYRYLKDRSYPDKAALKLVGDHHRLSSVLRNCLFRAVFSTSDCRYRRAKLVADSEVEGKPIGVDWYNILITVESYLRGLPVFVSQDGLVRDSSGVHGSYKSGKVTERGMKEILWLISDLKPSRVDLFLDSPISHSGEMAEELRSRLSQNSSPPHQVSVAQSADYQLKKYSGIVATSDSSIIDKTEVELVFDLAARVIESRFRGDLPAVENLPKSVTGG